MFAGWLKQPGDTVTPGEPLFMLEGEKATQEIEAVDGGVLRLAPDAPTAGQTVLVGHGRSCGSFVEERPRGGLDRGGAGHHLLLEHRGVGRR